MKPPAFSTCWNSQKHRDGQSVIREIRDLGFDTVEVSHGMKLNLLPGIMEAARKGEIRVSGVHNFCPSPLEVLIDAPDCYEFTSHRKHDRDRAIALTKTSLETAARLGGTYLVLHLGTVPMKPCSGPLAKLCKQGHIYSRTYVRRKMSAVAAREKIAHLYLARAREAIEILLPEAEKLGVILAVEMRSHYEQIPTFPEARKLLNEFAASPWIGYWHDFGHAQLQHNLGFHDHEELLRDMLPNWVGAHIHDVQWPSRDHHVPFSRNGIDFSTLLPLLPPDRPLVWELSHRRPADEIRRGLQTWQAIG